MRTSLHFNNLSSYHGYGCLLIEMFFSFERIDFTHKMSTSISSLAIDLDIDQVKFNDKIRTKSSREHARAFFIQLSIFLHH